MPTVLWVGVSQWLAWWAELHPDQQDLLGSPTPLACAREQEGEPVFIKNTFDGFFNTGLDKYLRCTNRNILTSNCIKMSETTL